MRNEYPRSRKGTGTVGRKGTGTVGRKDTETVHPCGDKLRRLFPRGCFAIAPKKPPHGGASQMAARSRLGIRLFLRKKEEQTNTHGVLHSPRGVLHC